MKTPRFDSNGLFRALEGVRRSRGLSWRELAAEAGVAVSTLRETQLGHPMEADGVLAMVRLAGRVPEDFAPGIAATKAITLRLRPHDREGPVEGHARTL